MIPLRDAIKHKFKQFREKRLNKQRGLVPSELNAEEMNELQDYIHGNCPVYPSDEEVRVLWRTYINKPRRTKKMKLFQRSRQMDMFQTGGTNGNKD